MCINSEKKDISSIQKTKLEAMTLLGFLRNSKTRNPESWDDMSGTRHSRWTCSCQADAEGAANSASEPKTATQTPVSSIPSIKFADPQLQSLGGVPKESNQKKKLSVWKKMLCKK